LRACFCYRVLDDSSSSSRVPLPPSPTLFPYTTLFRSRARRGGYRGRTVSLTLRNFDFGSIHRSLTLPEPTNIGRRIFEGAEVLLDRKSTRLNSSHVKNSYAVFCLKKKKYQQTRRLLRH